MQWAVLMLIAKPCRARNCKCLNSKGIFPYLSVSLWLEATVSFPVKIVVSIIHHFLDWESSCAAKIHVSKKNDGHVNFQSENVRLPEWHINRIEESNFIVDNFVFIHHIIDGLIYVSPAIPLWMLMLIVLISISANRARVLNYWWFL